MTEELQIPPFVPQATPMKPNRVRQQNTLLHVDKPSNFPNADALLRMNFLYQAAKLLRDKNPILSSFYIKEVKQAGEKRVLRMYIKYR